jgi:UDP-glucose 4-epimerase
VRLLVTGGAGYVGSVCAAHLMRAGHEVTILDDLSQGHEAAIPRGARLERVDLLDRDGLRRALEGGYDGVLHFAARALVEESVRRPELYWHTNVGGTRNLLDAMRDAGVRRLVFSSTCAVYGVPPENAKIHEDMPTRPLNSYGASKLAVDLMIGGEATAYDLAAVSLRYFNVAGASGDLGEDHDPETHLIPLILEVARGKRERVSIYGTDYPTPDGTAVRDYIHIEDLAEAHRLALEAGEPGRHAIFNLGSGDGYSVREVIDAAREVTGHEIPAVEAGRRAGDPPMLVAANDRVRSELGWLPQRGLREILADAWAWHSAHPDGYGDRG